LDEFVVVVLTGLATGVPYFLLGSGLTLTFGVMRVMNFAHGAFFMFGAFFAASLLGSESASLTRFLVVACGATAFGAAIGLIAERTVFRFIKHEFADLLASFGLMLFLVGFVEKFWGGSSTRTVSTPKGLLGSISIGNIPITIYDLFLIGVGVILAVALQMFMRYTWAGVKMQAVAADPTMAAALGIRTGLLSLIVFIAGAALAGFAGAIMAPFVGIDSNLAEAFILQAFVVLLIGGLGSVMGALLGSIILGLADSITVFYAPGLEAYSLYIVFALVMLIRPFGLFPTETGARE
jgi:branched-chain amino acid transport system permease protein